MGRIFSLDLLPQELTPCPLAAEFQEPVSRCRACGRDVLDLSQFTREEAARLLSTTEPPCVRVALHGGKPVFRNVARAVAITAVAAGAAAALLQPKPTVASDQSAVALAKATEVPARPGDKPAAIATPAPPPSAASRVQPPARGEAAHAPDVRVLGGIVVGGPWE